jgi:hypothetical protein
MEWHSRPRHAAAGNVWLGFSAADQNEYEHRIRIMRPLRWRLGPYLTLFADLRGSVGLSVKYWPENEGDNPNWSPLKPYVFSHGGSTMSVPYLNLIKLSGDPGELRPVISQCREAEVPVWVEPKGTRWPADLRVQQLPDPDGPKLVDSRKQAVAP